MAMLTLGRRSGFAGVLSACMSLAAASAPATALSTTSAKPPAVVTGLLPTVGVSSAVLKGMINPRGSETSYVFQYGPSTTYDAQTTPASAGAGTGEVKVSQPIAGLQSGTVYHYRLVATNASGTTFGADAALTTKKIPLTFKVAGRPDPSIFGGSFSVSGTLVGSGAAGHAVVLQANTFPYLGGFKPVDAPRVTDAAGNFSFTVASLLENTQFRVTAPGTPPINSPVVVGRVAVRVSLHLGSTGRHGFVRMYGAVTPAAVGAAVGCQLLRPGQKPLTVGGTKTKHSTASSARFSAIVRIRRGGLYRVYVQVQNGKQVSGHSRSLRIN